MVEFFLHGDKVLPKLEAQAVSKEPGATLRILFGLVEPSSENIEELLRMSRSNFLETYFGLKLPEPLCKGNNFSPEARQGRCAFLQKAFHV